MQCLPIQQAKRVWHIPQLREFNGRRPCSNDSALTTLGTSPLFRRVGIYLGLSTAAVTVLNQLEIEQQSAYQIYIPIFIGIYIVSRWLDSRFNQASSQQASQHPQSNKTQDRTSPSTTDRGFGQ